MFERSLVWLYPCLLSAYPAWRLYLLNQDRMSLAGALVSIATILLACISIQTLFKLVLQTWSRAALMTSVAAILFWIFSPLTRALYRGKYVTQLALAEDIVAVCFCIALGVLTLLVRKNRHWDFGPLHRFLGISVCSLYAFLVFSPAQKDEIPSSLAQLQFSPLKVNQAALQDRAKPDVYLIVLDAYGRSDELARVLSYDNSDFIRGLEAAGFFVADKATSNYAQTLLSLPSLLNLDYLSDVLAPVSRKAKNRAPLRNLLRTSRVVASLQELGYEFVFIGSGYAGTEMPQAQRQEGLSLDPGEFGNLLVTQSPLPTIARHISAAKLRYWQYALHRERLRVAFDKLAQNGQSSVPRFVLAHILAPHPPFVFGPQGEAVNADRVFGFHDGNQFRGSREEYRKGYAGQARWVEQQALASIKSILQHSPNAIIILQGDHGSGLQLNWRNGARTDLRERMSILNAYRVPEEIRKQLYSSVTPVNSFRLVLNYLADMQLELLPDKNYFSVIDRPYAFVDVTERVAAN